jgi:uncharacterized protein (DUF433 family)
VQRFDRITWNPNQMNGQPCIRGLRLTVRRVVEALAVYQVQQALEFAAANLEDSAAEGHAA